MIEYLQHKGYQFTKLNTESVTSCPFCSQPKHFYINQDKGVFYCHKCNEAGNIWKLKKHFGEFSGVVNVFSKTVKGKVPPKDKDIQLKEQLKEDGLRFLKMERGFTDNIIKQFNLGYDNNYISIPYYQNGELVNFKYRNIISKEFKREEGCQSTLYNVDNIDKKLDVIIVEGEFDCISAVQLGYDNVISVSIGAGAFNNDWIDFFDSCKGNFYITYDNDQKGDEGALSLAKKLGMHRCYRVKLPVKDFNDCLMAGYKKTELDNYFSNAEICKPEHLVHVSSVLCDVEDMWRSPDKGKGLQIDNWHKFNEKLGGFREAEITTVTGETSSGKSTWCLNIAYQLLNQGESALIISTEMQPKKVMSKMFSMKVGKSLYNFDNKDMEMAVLHFSSKSLFFVNVHGKLSIDKVCDYLEYCQRKYNIKFAILDHLHFFIDPYTDRLVNEIEKFMRELVSITLKTSMNIFLVAHPSKLNNTSGIVNMNDIKGSSAIKQDSHNVVTIWRDKELEKTNGKNEVIVEFQKVRDPAGTGGSVRYSYDMNSQIYTEVI